MHAQIKGPLIKQTFKKSHPYTIHSGYLPEQRDRWPASARLDATPRTCSGQHWPPRVYPGLLKAVALVPAHIITRITHMNVNVRKRSPPGKTVVDKQVLKRNLPNQDLHIIKETFRFRACMSLQALCLSSGPGF